MMRKRIVSADMTITIKRRRHRATKIEAEEESQPRRSGPPKPLKTMTPEERTEYRRQRRLTRKARESGGPQAVRKTANRYTTVESHSPEMTPDHLDWLDHDGNRPKRLGDPPDAKAPLLDQLAYVKLPLVEPFVLRTYFDDGTIAKQERFHPNFGKSGQPYGGLPLAPGWNERLSEARIRMESSKHPNSEDVALVESFRQRMYTPSEQPANGRVVGATSGNRRASRSGRRWSDEGLTDEQREKRDKRRARREARKGKKAAAVHAAASIKPAVKAKRRK